MLWSRDIKVEIQGYSRSYIDAFVTDPESGFQWRITGFYGNPKTHQRKESWDLLKSLSQKYQLPWLCFDDFNEIVVVEEKLGGVQRSQKQMDEFREAIHHCRFKDLGYCGPEFTWCNMQEDESRLYLRLDRALATPEWVDHYKNIKVYHLVESTSDHCALLISDDIVVQKHPNRRRFQFEAMWARREECKNIIQEVWDGSQELNSPSGIAARLSHCAENLSRWNKMEFRQIPKQIQKKREILSTLVCRDKDGSLGSEINVIRKEINELLDSEEIMWHQRSKVQWLGLGDPNMKYFHTKASNRRRRNTINSIRDENGNWHESIDGIAEVAVSYFKNLYSTSYPTCILEVLDTIPTKVTEDMNQRLIQEFTREEVEAALKQMHPTKAPDPDGMSVIFFQKYLGIVGNDVICMVLNVLNSNISMVEINRTNITLVPKIKNPTKITDFRPISLCNVVYKLISKVLAKRLKIIIPQIISENQSAFLSGRLITDNVLVAFELMNYLEHKKDGREGVMAIKLDMSKAYDRVEWGFIKQVMEKMGFNEKWIELIMHCITFVSYSVLVNGVAYGSITPSRDGDPISPYIFLLCADCFSSLINNAAMNQRISGVSICRGCPKITHLFFADDSLLFCKANSQECQTLIDVLQLYEAASDQKINADKSLVFFSSNIPNDRRCEVLNMLGPMQDTRHKKYLGLPSIIGKSKVEIFAKEKIIGVEGENAFSGWSRDPH